MANYSSSLDLHLGALPDISSDIDPALYSALVDIHSAIEKLSGTTTEYIYTSSVVVHSAAQLIGPLSSTVLYIIDGVIDMGTGSIIVPAGGLTLRGLGKNVSGLVSSQDSFTLFTSPVGGSGDLKIHELYFFITGTGSSVFGITAALGTEAVELSTVNFNSCTSLGYIDGYRQGLETDTGRFGGTPTLELRSPWAGGYRATTTIVRNLDNAMNAPLFKAGTGLTMGSRFLTDMNADLGTTASIVDFVPANFTLSSLLQFSGALITRNGVLDPEDASLVPNIFPSSLESAWRDNIGLSNTYEGGTNSISTAVTTTISVIGTYYALAGIYTASELDHFDAPANNRLRNLAATPREFTLYLNMPLNSTAGNMLSLRVMKYKASTAATSILYTQDKEVYNFVGPNDYALVNFFINIILDQGDYIYLEVANTSSTGNITADVSGYYKILKR